MAVERHLRKPGQADAIGADRLGHLKSFVFIELHQ